MNTARLGLGTVQFGLDYGISNQRGRVSEEQAAQILSTAERRGVTMLDTAAGYGDSERVLGRMMVNYPGRFRVVTKMTATAATQATREEGQKVRAVLAQSLNRLGLPSVYGLLAHRAADLLQPGGQYLIDAMVECKSLGQTEKIGVSVYSGAEIDKILELFIPDIVQLPINVADQRLIHSGHLDLLKRHGVEIHARSMFLQGLLLMSPEALPDYFSPVRSRFAKIRAAFVEQQWTALEGCIRFAMGRPELDVVLAGVTGVDELEEILGIVQRIEDGRDEGFFPPLAIEDEPYLNPAQWKIAQ
ncbi:MAG: aldo/keto reductase [Magnetococcales bacterium]|nr:aldo/keto reductase [Magnetococcales bacterium]